MCSNNNKRAYNQVNTRLRSMYLENGLSIDSGRSKVVSMPMQVDGFRKCQRGVRGLGNANVRSEERRVGKEC